MVRRILVADQDPNLISLYRLILEKQGHVVLGALDGKQCLETLARTEVDLILLDLLLADQDSTDTLAHLQSSPAWRTIPIIIVSSLSRQVAMESGALPEILAGYLRKPFPIASLLQQVNGPLAQTT
jgi:CheY-like chemotaxis protein